MDILAELDGLAALRDRRTVAELAKEELRQRILAPVKQELADLDAEYQPVLDDIDAQIAAVEQVIRQYVLFEVGASVKSSRIQVVYSKGRETWDGKRLVGYAAAHPEVLQFRTLGEPSVSIRVNGK